MLYYLRENNLNDFNIEKIEKYRTLAQLKLEEYKNKTIDYLDKIDNSIYKDILINLTKITL